MKTDGLKEVVDAILDNCDISDLEQLNEKPRPFNS